MPSLFLGGVAALARRPAFENEFSAFFSTAALQADEVTQ